MSTIEELIAEAKQLPEDQRLTLAHRLLVSNEPSVSEDVERAWDLTIRERIARYDAGQVQTRPAREVFAELDRRLGS
jgi:hypothetical protein